MLCNKIIYITCNLIMDIIKYEKLQCYSKRKKNKLKQKIREDKAYLRSVIYFSTSKS